MSILDGLRHPRARGYEKSYPQGYSPFVAYDEALDDVRGALRSDETRQKITEVLADNGVQPNTDAMHSWRCNEPDRFPGYCSCVPQLVDDLIDALAGGDQ